jgi:hypothetical protein
MPTAAPLLLLLLLLLMLMLRSPDLPASLLVSQCLFKHIAISRCLKRK